MSTYAILGATGATGQCLLNLLLQSPDNRVHAYVRSKSKLEQSFPKLAANPNAQIFAGPLTDIPLIAACVTGTSTVFVALGKNVNQPGMRVVQDGAHSLVAALSHIRAQDASAKLPKILVLSSASINPSLRQQMPAFATKLLHTGLSYAYEDLRRAQAYYELHKSWLNVTFIQPPGLTKDVQKGHALSTENAIGFISYSDLAAGMIEVAETEGDIYSWKGVAVVATAKDVKFNRGAPLILLKGLFTHYLPLTYGIFHALRLTE